MKENSPSLLQPASAAQRVAVTPGTDSSRPALRRFVFLTQAPVGLGSLPATAGADATFHVTACQRPPCQAVLENRRDR
jgi:hypothetical protein